MERRPLKEQPNAVSEKTNLLFEKFCNHLKAGKTAREYAYLLTDLCRHTDFLDLTTKQVTDYFSKLERENYSDSTMLWQVRAFRSFAKFIDAELETEPKTEEEDGEPQKQESGDWKTCGHYESLFPEFPFEHCTLAPAPVPDYAAVDRVLGQLLCDQQYGAYGAVCLVLRCGFTSEEICSITKDRLVMDDNQNVGVVFSDDSDPSERFVRLPADCVSVLSVLAHASSDQSLFRSCQRNVPLTVKTLQVALRNACKKRAWSRLLFRNCGILRSEPC